MELVNHQVYILIVYQDDTELKSDQQSIPYCVQISWRCTRDQTEVPFVRLDKTLPTL